jgi:hypothetical protein
MDRMSWSTFSSYFSNCADMQKLSASCILFMIEAARSSPSGVDRKRAPMPHMLRSRRADVWFASKLGSCSIGQSGFQCSK